MASVLALICQGNDANLRWGCNLFLTIRVNNSLESFFPLMFVLSTGNHRVERESNHG